MHCNAPRITTAVIATLLLTASSVCALTGEQILAKMDQHRTYRNISYQGTMTIHIGERTRVKTMHTVAETAEETKALVRFTNPEDNGTKYLMRGEDLWIYFPEEEDVVKISGHMLKEGMMGSDVSYEDALESDELSEKYDVSLDGLDTLDGRECHVVRLDATVKDAPYYQRTMWVDTERFVALKEEMYAKSGKLLKVSNVLEVKNIDGRYVPTAFEMVNQLRRNSKTVFEMNSVEFNVAVDENLFSMRRLRR